MTDTYRRAVIDSGTVTSELLVNKQDDKTVEDREVFRRTQVDGNLSVDGKLVLNDKHPDGAGRLKVDGRLRLTGNIPRDLLFVAQDGETEQDTGVTWRRSRADVDGRLSVNGTLKLKG